METGTQKNNDVDYSWLPEGAPIPGSPSMSIRVSFRMIILCLFVPDVEKSPRMRKNKTKNAQ